MADSTPNTTRRGFLGAFAALSAAALPVVTQAATLDPWDRFEAGLAIIAPNAPKAVFNCKAAGMKPEWIYSIVTLDTPAHPILLFQRPDGEFFSIGPQDVWMKADNIPALV